MKYFSIPLSKEKEKEYKDSLTSLDKAVLRSASKQGGAHIVGILAGCKPFVNKYDQKVFPTTPEVLRSVEKLVRGGLIERR